jgi:hypothetical protein
MLGSILGKVAQSAINWAQRNPGQVHHMLSSAVDSATRAIKKHNSSQANKQVSKKSQKHKNKKRV